MKPQNFTTIQSTKVNPTHLLDEKFGGNSVPVFAALTPGLFSSRNNVQSQYYSLILILYNLASINRATDQYNIHSISSKSLSGQNMFFHTFLPYSLIL